MLKESGDKMKAEDKSELEVKVADLQKAKESDNIEEMKKALEALNTVAQRIGAAMYQQASQAPTEGAPASESPNTESANKDDQVVEGEVEEKK